MTDSYIETNNTDTKYEYIDTSYVGAISGILTLEILIMSIPFPETFKVHLMIREVERREAGTGKIKYSDHKSIQKKMCCLQHSRLWRYPSIQKASRNDADVLSITF
jgi:hypothetical protein